MAWHLGQWRLRQEFSGGALTVSYRTFGSNMVPGSTGTVQDRGGGVQMQGTYAQFSCWNGSIYVPMSLRVLRMWEVQTSEWQTFWNPVAPSSMTTCICGTARDQPLSGFIDRDGA
jgi:hypothetical protein